MISGKLSPTTTPASWDHFPAGILGENVMGLEMINILEDDLTNYGEKVFHHTRKQGNHRWDTTVRVNHAGCFTAIYRRSYSKKVDGKKKSFIQAETLVKGENAAEFLNAEFPNFPDTVILKESEFFKSLMN